MLRLRLRHGWKTAYYSPENLPVEYHLKKIADKLLGRNFAPGYGMTEELYDQARQWLAANVTHILPGDGAYRIDDTLLKARQLVRRRGVRTLVIDPMNRLEQDSGMTERDFIRSVLNKLCRLPSAPGWPRHPRSPPPQGQPQRSHRRTAPCGDERHQRLRRLRQHDGLLYRRRP